MDKIITCQDCRQTFRASIRANNVSRCPVCQAARNKRASEAYSLARKQAREEWRARSGENEKDFYIIVNDPDEYGFRPGAAFYYTDIVLMLQTKALTIGALLRNRGRMLRVSDRMKLVEVTNA